MYVYNVYIKSKLYSKNLGTNQILWSRQMQKQI